MNRDNQEYDCERRGLRHIHSEKKRCRAGKQCDEPNEDVSNAIFDQKPVAGDNGEAAKEERCDLSSQPWIAELRKRNLNYVKKEVVVDVVFWIQCGKRQPGKGGNKLA